MSFLPGDLMKYELIIQSYWSHGKLDSNGNTSSCEDFENYLRFVVFCPLTFISHLRIDALCSNELRENNISKKKRNSAPQKNGLTDIRLAS